MLIEIGIIDARNIISVMRRAKTEIDRHENIVDHYLLGAIDQVIVGMTEFVTEAGHTVE